MKVELIWEPKVDASLERGQNIIEEDVLRDSRIAVLERKAEVHDLRLYALENPKKKAARKAT
jgi:hypothetical protein